MEKEAHLKGYLQKNNKTNKVSIIKEPTNEVCSSPLFPIETNYRPLAWGEHTTLLEVQLLTGKPHQIRAHLASIGHALLGDRKYGGEKEARDLQAAYQISHQLLHAYRLVFPESNGVLANLSGKAFLAKAPTEFCRICKRETVQIPEFLQSIFKGGV